MELHDLILICASLVAGFTLHILLELWADHRAKPYRDGWRQSYNTAVNCQMREAYRAGQEQVYLQQPHVIDAPAPWQ